MHHLHALASLVLLSAPAAGQYFSQVLDQQVRPMDLEETATGYLLLTRDYDYAHSDLLQLDSAGQVLWQRRYDDVVAEGIEVLASGEILMWGSHQSLAWFGRLDASGTIVDQFQWTEPGQVFSHIKKVTPLADGGLAVVGNTSFSAGYYGWDKMLILRLDAAGAITWRKTITFYSPWYPQAYGTAQDIAQLADGGLILSGYFYWDGANYAIAFEPDGTIRWEQFVAMAYNSTGCEVEVGPGGEVYLGSEGYWWDYWSALLRVDPATGDYLWARSLPDHWSAFGDLVIAANGNPTWGHDASIDDLHQVRLTQLDPAGNTVFDQVYVARDDNWFGHLSATSAGFGLSGAIQTAGYTPWFAHTGPTGTEHGCGALPYPLPTGDHPDWVPADVIDLAHEVPGDHLVTGTAFTSASSVTYQPGCWGTVGTSYCSPSVSNSSGKSATMEATGTSVLSWNDLRLIGRDMATNQFGYFVTGQGTSVIQPPGSQGLLCLDGSTIYRYASQVGNTGAAGGFELPINLNAVPGHGAIQPGETWNFQAWFRDANPGSTSNFTDALAVGFF